VTETERGLEISGVKRCSECIRGVQLVGSVGGGSESEDGLQEKWYIAEPIPIGQQRNCFGYLETILFEPEKFIYPGHDDTCINPQRYKHI
jgi:hypothetical protein